MSHHAPGSSVAICVYGPVVSEHRADPALLLIEYFPDSDELDDQTEIDWGADNVRKLEIKGHSVNMTAWREVQVS